MTSFPENSLAIKKQENPPKITLATEKIVCCGLDIKTPGVMSKTPNQPAAKLVNKFETTNGLIFIFVIIRQIINLILMLQSLKLSRQELKMCFLIGEWVGPPL